MTKQEQIEEMADILCQSKNHKCDGEDCKCIKQATDLYNKKCRILAEDSVVLTKKEYETLKNESIDKLFVDDTFFKEEFKANEEYLKKRANQDYIKLVKGQVRRDTAKEFAEKIKEKYGHYWCYLYKKDLKQLRTIIDELLKEYEK